MLTHWLEDTHPDHVASVRLVIEALLHYAVSHGLEDVDASRRAFPQVWSCDTYGGLGSRGAFAPEWYIDISAVWEQKIHALAAHQSQTPAHWTELIRRHNAFYGARCNRQYAEGFRRLPGLCEQSPRLRVSALLGSHGCGDGGGCCRAVEFSPICEEETMSILSSLERPVGERSTRRSTPVQHLPPPLPRA